MSITRLKLNGENSMTKKCKEEPMRRLTLTMILFVLCASLLSFSVTGAFAGSEDETGPFAARIAGMGGAFVAVADDENTLYWNPAGLKNLSGNKFIFFNPTLQWGKDLNKIKDLQDDLDKNKNDINEITKAFNRHAPINFPANLSWYPVYVTPGWGLGLSASASVRAYAPKIQGASFGEIQVTAFQDVTLTGAYPYVLNEKLTLGASVNVINRTRYFEKPQYGGSSLITLSSADLVGGTSLDKYVDKKSATGIAINLGALYKLNNKVTLGGTLNNIGATSFNYSGGVKDNIRGTMTIGAQWIPGKQGILKGVPGDGLKIAMDISQLFTGGSTFLKLHIGAETKIASFADIRLGLNQGYPTFGIGLHWGFLNIDYAYFQQELGNYAGQQKDQSHVLGLALKF